MEYEVYPRTTRTEVAPKGAFPFLEENMRRPINPVIPYPNEAIQHTRCVLALSMITVAISFLKPETLAQLGDLGKQVEKVNRWRLQGARQTWSGSYHFQAVPGTGTIAETRRHHVRGG